MNPDDRCKGCQHQRSEHVLYNEGIACDYVLDEEPLPAGGTRKTYCACTHFEDPVENRYPQTGGLQ